VNGVSNHVVVTNLETGLLGKFVPDSEPITVLLINLLTTNINRNVLDKTVSNIVNPAEVSRSRARAANFGEGNLKIDAGN